MATNFKTSDLSLENVLRDVHDIEFQRLRVDAQASINSGQFEVVIKHTEDSIRLGDGTTLSQFNYGNSAAALRTAAQIGNSTGQADFAAGNSTAQTLRVAIAAEQLIDVDIRNLTFAQDKVDVTGSTVTVIQPNHDNLNLNANIQVNNTDVSNANPVPISDAGGSITIDNANLVSIDGKLSNNYGASTGAIRTASQIGNTTGAADFNSGTTGAQTLRTTANITRNGAELSYGAGATDANTLRVSANITSNGNSLDTNFGTVGANTLRSAAQLADGAGNQITSAASNTNRLLHIQAPDTVSATGTFNATSASTQINLVGLNSVGFQLNSGSFIGTIVAQCSLDGGTTWLTVPFIDNINSATFPTGITFTTANPLKILEIKPIGGSSNVRVIVTAFTSGSATGLIRASTISGTNASVAVAAFGTATNTYPALAANTVALILPANPNRKFAVFSNNSAISTLRIQLGSSTGLTTSRGINVPSNAYYELKGDNLFTGEVYGISSGAITISVSEGVP